MTLLPLLALAAAFVRPMERVASMDPIEVRSIYDAAAVALVYETPLEVDYSARPYRLTPGLCELPSVSSDGLVYTFRMVPGAALAAADVVRSLERLRDPANASPDGWTMKKVASLRTLDDGAFEVRLSERFHVFPWMMAMASSGVRAADGSGTGPYRLKSWWRNHEMVFERNAAWRGWGGGGASARPFDEIRYLVVNDPSTQWLMFLRGELDFLSEVSRDNWDAVADADGRLNPRLAREGVSLHALPSLDVRYLGFNMRDGVVGGNRRLRQALNCAFDAPAWTAFYNRRVTPADGPVPPNVEGRLETPFAYAYDLGKAKRLLAEAGYPDGIDATTGRRLTLRLSIGRPTQDSREAGELIASFYARIGIRLELDFSTWVAFMKAVDEGRTQMFLLGWVADYPDAENFLQLFHSRNVSPGANHSCYVNAEYDAEYDAAMASGDAGERNRHWRRCQEIVREDCPWVFNHFTKQYSLIRGRVGDYVPSDFFYGKERNLTVRDEK